MNEKSLILDIYTTMCFHSRGMGHIRKEGNRIIGYEPYIEDYSIDLEKDVDGNYHIMLTNGNHDFALDSLEGVLNHINWIYQKRRDKESMAFARLSEFEDSNGTAYTIDDLNSLPELKGNYSVLNHMNQMYVKPFQVHENLTDYYYFWLIENNIYKSLKEVKIKYNQDLDDGLIMILESGQIVEFK